MIELVRVDYRLLHGQVAVSWVSQLGIDCVLLVTNTLKNDPMRVTSVKLAKPEGCKLVVKNAEESIQAVKEGLTDQYKLLVVCETVKEAVTFTKELGIKSLNLGNTKPGEEKIKLESVIFVDEEEKQLLDDLCDNGVDVFIQMVPDSKRIKIRQ